MDWNNLIADKNMIMNKNYTPGRSDSIRGVVLHHNAGNLTTEGCYSVWQTREASAHYQVEIDGTIGQLVHDKDTAWHAGSANPWTIGIEHANNSSVGWTISDATLEAGAHLVAAICKYYGLGRPQWMANVFPHSHFMATGCPGAIGGSQNAVYMARAQAWYDAMVSGSTPSQTVPSTPTTGSKTIDEIAQEVIAGSWGNGQERVDRLTAAGYDYNAVQNRVNEILGGGSVSTPSSSVDEIARQVIAGDWGNGQERADRLTAAGYDYNAVQNRVNELL